MNIEVISQEIIKPSIQTPDYLRYLQISLIDQLNSPFFIPTIYFFTRPKNTTPLETTSFLNKLKSSLSSTLSICYPLAGRLHNANHVKCNDEGVPYLHAEIESTRMADVVKKAQISDLDSLTPSFNQTGFPRLMMAIQVNIFSCGGVAIGVKSNHRITDGFSLLMFLNAWADITNGKDPAQIAGPYFDTAKLFPPQYSPIDILDDTNPHVLIDKPVAKWFMFTREKIDGLRSKLCSSKNIKSQPSIFTVLSAFSWSRIILTSRIDNDHNGNDVPFEVFIPVNMRPNVSNPYENSFYYGNMVVNAIVKPLCDLGDDVALCCDFIEKVNNSVNNIINNNSDLIKGMKEGKEDLKFVTEQFERVSKGKIKLLGFSNVPSLPVLEPDFGWGNPVWSVTGTMVDGLVIISRAGPYSKDFIATISMKKEDVAKLEADEVFNSFVLKNETYSLHSDQ
ncbi:hypothetical protein RND81_11G092900 [Saponaria officinalis]|uniref:Transferase, Chloramphenicol acetyltransferase-like domain protein n=1 Tax=Saponaria officinalis TaxID=3572 RepID=A0AAW1HIX3_SAPOF